MRKVFKLKDDPKLDAIWTQLGKSVKNVESMRLKLSALASKHQNLINAFWNRIFTVIKEDKNSRYEIKDGYVCRLTKNEIDKLDRDYVKRSFMRAFNVDDSEFADSVVKEIRSGNIPGAINLLFAYNQTDKGKEVDNVVKFEKND